MVADEDLARGVVIGRSEKCHAEMLRRITDENTSRVHILVLREGPVIHAYDLASTQGTFVNGAPARRVVLHDGATLNLGRGENSVRLHWQARS
jgi:pSer/pThr/pTyr-binding forkhead associated (FHA) protein